MKSLMYPDFEDILDYKFNILLDILATWVQIATGWYKRYYVNSLLGCSDSSQASKLLTIS